MHLHLPTYCMTVYVQYTSTVHCTTLFADFQYSFDLQYKQRIAYSGKCGLPKYKHDHLSKPVPLRPIACYGQLPPFLKQTLSDGEMSG